MNAMAPPSPWDAGHQTADNPWPQLCLANFSRSSTSNARWVRSGPTTTGPLLSYLQISISSSLLGCLEKDELRSAAGGVPPCFLQTEDVSIKGDRLFQIGHAITGMQ